MVLSAILSVSGLGVAAGFILAVAAKKFAVYVDPKIEKIEDVLPGVNCGACGYGGCSAYAKGIVNDNDDVNLCTPGGEEVANQIAEIMGVEAGAVDKKLAVIHCAGDNRYVSDRFEYRGLKTCASAQMLAGGVKECAHGCLGFGDCAAICPYDAIYLTPFGLAVVDPEKCVACGKCIDACPRKLITLEYAKHQYQVLCSSQDSPKIKRKICQVACIGCKMCVKQAPNVYEMDGQVARIKAGDWSSDEASKGALSCPNAAIADYQRYSPHDWLMDAAKREEYKALQAEEKKRQAAEKKKATEAKKAAKAKAEQENKSEDSSNKSEDSAKETKEEKQES